MKVAAINLLPQNGELFLLPNFIGEQEAADFYNKLEKEIDWQLYHIKIFGKLLAQPRLSAWYGNVSYTYSGIRLEPKPFSPLIEEIKQKIELATGHTFNSVLLNLYRDGNDSMGWHSDDEKELGINPVIASLSVGANRLFKVKHKQQKGLGLNLNLGQGSLLVMGGEMQHSWQHAIPKSSKACLPRINLTFRKIY
ncbi:MAG: alpha-ketoglutarate-dependent dioxygenase AlkB [Bacteroidetes bacterium B1(2017)]|nr:MAG: alpha-ketoglutarate-dependent dioxygenase AlkB [Bacteroidetes bacterium B1(2017)]